MGEAVGSTERATPLALNALPAFVDRIPISFARGQRILGLAGEEAGVLVVAMASEGSWPAAQNAARLLGRAARPVLTDEAQILAAINVAYQERTGQAASAVESLDRGEVLREVATMGSHEDLLDTGGRAPVVRVVNLLLFEALQARASDVHIQPFETTLSVRLRIDGVLYDLFELPKHLQDEIVSRVKVMGKMDIAERRLPQDGRTTVLLGDRSIDLRIATLPTSFGERAVLRLLDPSSRPHSLTDLGMDNATLARFSSLISMDHGIILVTGPTGSGKTTTLYSALHELNSRELNILTLEDPIEYRLDRISQTQVSEKKGMTFASGLRSVLRQDPDIIMVGEIRDRETAVMAIQSALTGHLVFSTLHTNDAAGAVTRLLDLGIEPYLISSSLVGVLAQRLVRKVCAACGRGHEVPLNDRERLGVTRAVDLSAARLGPGCPICRHTGYKGRIGLFELLTMTDDVRTSVQARAGAGEVRAVGVGQGMLTLRDDGVRKVAAGVTTAQEVLRVAMRE